MATVIDCLNHDFWVSDLQVRQSRFNLFRDAERLVEHRMIADAKEIGLDADFDLVGDHPHHRWLDMETKRDYLTFYGPDAYDYEIKPQPPARWLLRSVWRVRDQ